MKRDYKSIARKLAEENHAQADSSSRHRAVVDALWESLSGLGCDWVGVYTFADDDPSASEMVLGHCRDAPACSPIGLHGQCGLAASTGEAQIVDDVRLLGEAHIECDPRNISEIVIPLFRQRDGRDECYGVLDVDSHSVAAFSPEDGEGLELVLEAVGIRCTPSISESGRS